jgi:adenylate cyclase
VPLLVKSCGILLHYPKAKENMIEESIPLAVLFADISGSTLLYETLGDQVAQKLVAECLRLLSGLAAHFQGTVIKNIGDEIMCTFPSADLAAEAAKTMQKAIEQKSIPTQQGVKKVSIRVGLHIGKVVREGDDVFGDAVNVAARVVSLAKARQILTTEQTVEAMKSQAQATIRRIERTAVKGKQEELNIYEIIWDQQGLTVSMQGPQIVHEREAYLELTFQDQTINLNRSLPAVTIGRNPDNKLVVDDAYTSRTHARIQHRRGKFVLVDESTNGTYLVNVGEKPVFLHMDEHSLLGKGIISLGRLVDAESPAAIHFACHY